uniref:REX1, RNA exonuclease 1 homolog n=2 Tax=Paramormyrops kingsleyae TaxID=1676925 RepID=A0A3B3SWX5_9TELE|nr:RNA exonuclease 1 homolog isoform X2 [Paramormyrops kingsleyae]
MLRSTGFFRGIDCPFYSESHDGRSDGDNCNRPYCHFRHSRQRRESLNANNRKPLQACFKQKEPDCEPYNPEVQNGELVSDVGPLGQGALELEMVNRAIEAMRDEVEREQKKLSRIGDQQYDPTASSIQLGAKRHKASATPLEYDPSSYQISPAADYNPTPCSSKYTLDSDDKNTYASALEYVPTTVTKTATKKPLPSSRTLRFPPPSPPRIPSSSSKCKYTLDNSKPPTDLEYDPLSNFSAHPGNKNNRSPKEQKCMGVAEVEAPLGNKKRGHSAIAEKQAVDESDNSYVPTLKKARQQPTVVFDSKKYSASFSESDDESSGLEYRPTSVSRLQKKKNRTVPTGDPVVRGDEKGECASAGKMRQRLSSETKRVGRSTVCDSEDSESLEFVFRDDRATGKKTASESSNKKSSKSGKGDSDQKESYKKSYSSKETTGSAGRDGKKPAAKKSGKVELKKDGKSEGESAEEMVQVKDSKTKSCKDLHKVKSDGKSSKAEKKGESGRKVGERGRSHPKGLRVSEKASKGLSVSHELKNGKLEGNRHEKEKKGHRSDRSSKDKRTETKKSSDIKPSKLQKEKPRSLSHADLFGDDSAEEEEEGNVVRKSAAAFKRRGLMISKRTASEVTGSSSEDEGGEQVDFAVGHDDEDDYGDGDSGGGSEDDFSSLQVDLDFDSDPMEECLRIFNESKDVKTEDKGRQTKQSQPAKDVEENEGAESMLTTLFPGQKKRVSHFLAKGNVELSPKPVVRPYRRPTAQEVCYQRMQIAQQQAAQLATAMKMAAATSSPAAGLLGEKRRVAHRPNPALSSAGPALSKQSGSGASPGTSSLKSHTFAGILSKTSSTLGQKRVAHTPTLQSSSLKRPVIPTEFGAKVPTGVRQRYLNSFIDECLKFCTSAETAFQMGLDEEKVVYERSSSKNIYLNVAVNTLKKLRSKSSTAAVHAPRSPAVKAHKRSLSHEEVLGGRLAAKTSFTVNRMGKQQEEELIGATLYKKLKHYLMTEEQLQEHGYPRPHPEHSGRAMVYNLPEKKNTDPLAKICCRCGAEYRITANGSCVRREECAFHWGRLRRHKVPGGWETQYSCCSGLVGSPGCQVSKQHVQDGRKESLDSYVKTFSKPLPIDGNVGVFALDCEMCYTKHGLELTRVTVINSQLKVIYDTFVKPESRVVDYNTRFSGVTQEDLESTTITLRDVQAVLLNMFSADSILIGHSLESDLFALKLLHSTVVDTAIVFPHRLGLPYKRALRSLMADYLKRIIQDNVEGHDSSEDASACMQLMMWKIREDAKVKR